MNNFSPSLPTSALSTGSSTMDEKNIIKEMFNGLFNTVTGPGFYTVDGVKRRKLKPKKTGTPENSPQKSSFDKESIVNSSIECVKNCDNHSDDTEISCKNDNENNLISTKDQFVSRDPVIDGPESDSIISSPEKPVRLKVKSKLSLRKTSVDGEQNKSLSCQDVDSTEQPDANDAKLASQPSPCKMNKETNFSCQITNNSNNDGKTHCSSPNKLQLTHNKPRDKHCEQTSDLVISTRRGKRKDFPNKKTVKQDKAPIDTGLDKGSDLLQICEMPASIDSTAGGLPITPGAIHMTSKDVDAQSDVSTDSRASGYTQSRSSTAMPTTSLSGVKRSPRHHKPRTLLNRLSIQGAVVTKPKNCLSSRQKSVKRKLNVGKQEDNIIPTKKVKQSQNSVGQRNPKDASKRPRKSSVPKTGGIRKSISRKAKTEHMVLGQKANSSRKSPRSQQRLKQTKKTQLQSRSKHKEPPVRKQAKRNTQKQKINAEESNVRKTSKQNSQKLPNRQKTSNEQSRAKHKHTKQQQDLSPKSSAYGKQQEVLAEHSKQAMQVEENNIISALCQLEDKSRAYKAQDLDNIIPMRDIQATNHNTVFGVRGQGHDHHPGGIWKRLIPEN